jgi:hypothetical protein
VVVPFKLPGRLVAQSRVPIRLMVIVDPRPDGTDESTGTRPFVQLETLFFPGSHAALRIRMAFGAVVTGAGLTEL